jgi:hypothetical protein
VAVGRRRAAELARCSGGQRQRRVRRQLGVCLLTQEASLENVIAHRGGNWGRGDPDRAAHGKVAGARTETRSGVMNRGQWKPAVCF